MIGRPNAQNKARKGVLRQRQGGARRERSQKQNFFRGRGQTLKPPQSRPTTARQEAPQEPPQKKIIRSATAARRPRWNAASSRILYFPDNFPQPVSEPDTLRRRAACGHPRHSLAHPQRARRASHPPPQKKPELKIGRRADLAARASRAKRRGPRPGALRQPFHSTESPPHPQPSLRRRPVRRNLKPRLGRAAGETRYK